MSSAVNSLILLAGFGGAALFVTSAAAPADVPAQSIAGYGIREHHVRIGASDNWLRVRGNGTSDLDCWVYGQDGVLVDSDVDATDMCLLETPGTGRYKLEVQNLGGRANRYLITRSERLR
ncbi:MAG: hypothetical protein IT361_13815 [Gemmatimonadaceae bacterium]|nr:hypothetical protein [Gemmatimonadaceae bacterium]